jgi:hypothetical protein
VQIGLGAALRRALDKTGLSSFIPKSIKQLGKRLITR